MVDTREIQVKAPRDWAGTTLRGVLTLALLPLRPLMVLSAWVMGRRPKEHQTVYLVRVQRSDGTVEQARVEQDIVGATMDLGDYVSIWGRDQEGVTIVQRAYNHTVGAEVRLRREMGPVISVIILVAIILFAIFICVAISNS